MVKEVINIDNTLSETEQIVKPFLPNSFVEVNEKETRRIRWTKTISFQIIECETIITSKRGITEISTYCQCGGISDKNPRKVLKNFHKSLIQHPKVLNPIITAPLTKEFNVEREQFNTLKKKPKSQNTPSTNQNSSPLKPQPILLGLSILFVIIVFLFTEENESTSNSYITNSGFYASYNEKDLDKFIRYINEDDNSAINTLFDTGKIISLPEGQEVFLVKSNFGGTVKIRPKGRTIEYWTLMEAIKKK